MHKNFAPSSVSAGLDYDSLIILSLADDIVCDNLWAPRRAYRLETSARDFVRSVVSAICADAIGIEVREIVSGTLVIVQRDANGIPMIVAKIDGEIGEMRRHNLAPMVSQSPSHDAVSRRSLSVTLFGEEHRVTAIVDALDAKYDGAQLASIEWWFQVGPDVHTRDVVLDVPKPFWPECYPQMDHDIAGYFKAYLDSDASALFLIGPPGTGKTSLLRHFLHGNRLAAMFTCDEAILASDGIFVSFLSGNAEVMILEDADLMLTSREHDGNRMAARFLSASDGLIKFPRKKIVFTTNLTDIGRIEPALLRPGRCFDVIEFRALTYVEACAAAKAASLPTPADERDYTLGELFNRGRAQTAPKRRVGF